MLSAAWQPSCIKFAISSQLIVAASTPAATEPPGANSHQYSAGSSAAQSEKRSASCAAPALCRPWLHELAPKCSRTIARTSAMNSLPHSGTAGLHPSGVTSYWRSRFRGTEKQW